MVSTENKINIVHRFYMQNVGKNKNLKNLHVQYVYYTMLYIEQLLDF